MKVAIRNLAAWDFRMRQTLRRATLRGGWLKEYMGVFPDAITIVLFNKRQVMGWAFCAPMDKTIYLQMFVNLRYRGNHLGTKLVEEALRRFPSITLAEWDPTTRRLFRKLRERYPGRIRIYSYTWARENRQFQQLRALRTQTTNGSMA